MEVDLIDHGCEDELEVASIGLPSEKAVLLSRVAGQVELDEGDVLAEGAVDSLTVVVIVTCEVKVTVAVSEEEDESV